jgi:hypothetical protein
VRSQGNKRMRTFFFIELNPPRVPFLLPKDVLYVHHLRNRKEFDDLFEFLLIEGFGEFLSGG